MDKYSNAKIYRLCHTITDTKIIDGITYKSEIQKPNSQIYIGSTCNSLEKRLYQHNYACANKDTTTQCTSYKLYDISKDVSIQLIENFPCKTKEELNIRERHWIETTANCINKNIPGREWDERHIDNRDHNLTRMKNWREANKDHVRTYNQTIKLEANEKAKERYANGYGEARNNKKKEKAICDVCQKEMNKNSLWTHKKSVHAPVSE